MKSLQRCNTPNMIRFAPLLLLPILAGCAGMSQVASGLAELGIVDENVVEAVEVAGAAGQFISAVNETFTPEQQYYVGRSVAAVILSQYDQYEDERATLYVNQLGQALALASPQPFVFKGYTFMILDSDEINAFATPGGHVFLTRGMIRLAETEDDLAAILAHEISHVVLQHGMKSIKASRINSSAIDLLATSADALTDNQIAELAVAFSGSIADMTETLVTSGYSRATEREADAEAVRLLATVGYDPNGLIRVLQRMAEVLEPDGLDFAKTHPDPEVRIGWVEDMIEEEGYSGGSDRRVTQPRFDSAVGDI
jgi:predicted Zn-dependent protease